MLYTAQHHLGEIIHGIEEALCMWLAADTLKHSTEHVRLCRTAKRPNRV